MTEKFMIFPEKGNTKVIARLLLDLATHPTEVEYVLWPAEGFRVGEELLLKFEAQFRYPSPEEPVADVVREEIPEPVKRKPGRPKKEAQ